jgi:hypothetical protein
MAFSTLIQAYLSMNILGERKKFNDKTKYDSYLVRNVSGEGAEAVWSALKHFEYVNCCHYRNIFKSLIHA